MCDLYFGFTGFFAGVCHPRFLSFACARLRRAQKAAAGPRGEHRAENEACFVFEPCRARFIPPPPFGAQRSCAPKQPQSAPFGFYLPLTDGTPHTLPRRARRFDIAAPCGFHSARRVLRRYAKYIGCDAGRITAVFTFVILSSAARLPAGKIHCSPRRQRLSHPAASALRPEARSFCAVVSSKAPFVRFLSLYT